MKKILIVIALTLFSTSGFAQTAATKPAVTIYNPKANAQADIDAAVAKAKKEKKHVFIQVGGNDRSALSSFRKEFFTPFRDASKATVGRTSCESNDVFRLSA